MARRAGLLLPACSRAWTQACSMWLARCFLSKAHRPMKLRRASAPRSVAARCAQRAAAGPMASTRLCQYRTVLCRGPAWSSPRTPRTLL